MHETWKLIADAMKPPKECPICGAEPHTKLSFKGIPQHKSKRKAQYCDCGWSRIIPTYREALRELGLLDE